MTSPKQRLDQAMADNGLAESRSRAAALIMAGQVTVNGLVVTKAGVKVDQDAEIVLKVKDHPFVSRGGVKLAHALHQFRIDPEGGVCLDVGASTGGFTDCLLQHGARKVWAIDVGTNQLDYRIRTDERVVCFEGVNAREFDLATVTDPIDIMVADVSFISLILAIPPLLPLLRPEGKMILLVKPQFEAGRGAVGKGGIVRDPVERERAVNRIIAFFAGIGYSCWGITPSPVEGRKGNVEYLIWLEAMHEGVCGRIVSTADVTGIFPSQTEM